MERKVKHLGGIITLLISVLFASCSPEDSILEAIHLKNTEFLESNDDYMILESTVIIYNTGNAYNNLDNEEIRYKAFHYAENSDLAQMYRDKARRLRNSTKLDSDYNPNWYEEAKRADRRKKGVCQYCGGSFKKALFGMKCTDCKKRKDYK